MLLTHTRFPLSTGGARCYGGRPVPLFVQWGGHVRHCRLSGPASDGDRAASYGCGGATAGYASLAWPLKGYRGGCGGAPRPACVKLQRCKIVFHF